MTLPPPLDWKDAGIGPGPDVPRKYRVTRENWRLYPFSRWAFQHTRELVPSRASRHAERGGSYRSQWWVSHNPYGGIAAKGVYGQQVYLEPVTGLALIRYGSHPLTANLHTDALHANAIEALRRFLT